MWSHNTNHIMVGCARIARPLASSTNPIIFISLIYRIFIVLIVDCSFFGHIALTTHAAILGWLFSTFRRFGLYCVTQQWQDTPNKRIKINNLNRMTLCSTRATYESTFCACWFGCESIFIILSYVLMRKCVWECETKEQLEQNNNSIILMAATVKRIQQSHTVSLYNFMRDSFIVWYENVNVFYLFCVTSGGY